MVVLSLPRYLVSPTLYYAIVNYIISQDYGFLRNAGVVGIFGPGTKITTAAVDVVKAISSAQ